MLMNLYIDMRQTMIKKHLQPLQTAVFNASEWNFVRSKCHRILILNSSLKILITDKIMSIHSYFHEFMCWNKPKNY
jgi:hypothetical protein